VASYTGLCPGEHSSGNKRVQGSVTKHGNLRLRASLVELAWRLVRFQPTYPPVRVRLALLAKGARATERSARKPSWLWSVTWRLICGGSAPANARLNYSASSTNHPTPACHLSITNTFTPRFGTWRALAA
jgi:hypothetical protein